jgi:hypothetical protein
MKPKSFISLIVLLLIFLLLIIGFVMLLAGELAENWSGVIACNRLSSWECGSASGRNGKAGEVKDCSNGTMLAAGELAENWPCVMVCDLTLIIGCGSASGGSGKAGEMKDHSNGTICIHYIEGHQLPCEYVDNAREDLASKIGGEPRNDGSWMRG